MQLPAFLALIAAVSARASVTTGQIPIVEGVLGGTPSSSKLSVAEKATQSSEAFDPAIRITSQNTSICETTEGVSQATGYGDLAEDQSLWFWYFGARNDEDNKAPLTLWFNGGPGSSSEIGLFQELGPCRITNDSSSVEDNPWAWNTDSHIIFIDQPIGVGFSLSPSPSPSSVGTSTKAAQDVWSFLQLLLADSKFSFLADRELAIWTESYGGHYGPTFASYILSQNDKIASSSIEGINLNLKYLGVGDGLTDPINQYPAFMEYAASNPYHPLVDDSVIAKAQTNWEKEGGCRDLIEQCNSDDGTDTVCSKAQSYCNSNILSPLSGDYDVYYVPVSNPDPYPADISDYLDSIKEDIGAEQDWQMTNTDVYSAFAATGDWMRTSAPALQEVIDAGVRTLVYVGDADYILNYIGIEYMVGNLTTSFSDEYASQSFSDFTVHGTKAGLYKNAGTFSYVRIFGAGHEVPAYSWEDLEVGEAGFQMFSQIMKDEGLSGT